MSLALQAAGLDPEDVHRGSVSIYALAGSIGVLLWDILDNVTGDYKLLFKSRLALSTAAYFGSRLGTLGYAISSAIFETAPTGNCIHFETITDIFYPISLGCSTFLFFCRLHALYNRNPIIVGCFFLLWLGLVACTSLIPIGLHGGTIAMTKYCQDASTATFINISIVAPWVHDTLVFIAISWRLFRNAHTEEGIKERIRTALFGKSLPAFSKGLLLDSQRYYLITCISNLAITAMIFNPSIPTRLRNLWTTPNIIVTNIMACRIYRKTKAGLSRESDISMSNRVDKSNPPLDAGFWENKVLDAPCRVYINPSIVRDSADSHSSNI